MEIRGLKWRSRDKNRELGLKMRAKNKKDRQRTLKMEG